MLKLAQNVEPLNHQKKNWKGNGYYWRSKASLFGIPLVCISFCYKNRKPAPAVGILAIGQFAVGIINISQIGVGVFSLSQITLSAFAVAQIAFAYKCIAQIGYAISKSYGQSISYPF
jgi:hypothetical protein